MDTTTHFVYSPPATPELPILYVDHALLVLSKPAGLLSVPGRGEAHKDSLSTRVQAHYPDALVVHRLDLETSGLIVMARGKAMQGAISRSFQERIVKKRYVARVHGVIPQQGLIHLPLLVDWPRRPRQAVNFSEGRPALTYYQRIQVAMDRQSSIVHLMPVTGRSHQLRVHLLMLGYPILGDTLYAPADTPGNRLMLHSDTLGFPHPKTGKWLDFVDPPPFNIRQ